MVRRPPRSALFPCTPLFRSVVSTGPEPATVLRHGGHSWDPRAQHGRVRHDRSSAQRIVDRKSTRLNSSHANISYAVFCLKKKKNKETHCNTQSNNISYSLFF